MAAKVQQTKGKTPKKRNIYAKRQLKKRRQLLRRCILFLLLVMAVIVLYQRRESWMPGLTENNQRNQSQIQDHDGRFPLSVAGNSAYQIGAADNRLAVLTDSYLNFYQVSGAQITSRQHTYGSAMLQTAGEYSLVYESGGLKFRLDTPAKQLYEKSTADQIMFGRVSSDGKAVLVTASETGACKLIVFNAKGQQLYERNCVENICDLCFHSDNGGCYAVSVGVKDGSLQSVVHSYSFSVKEALWSSQALDMLAVSVYNTGEGNVFVLGDHCCAFLGGDGLVRSTYEYPYALAGCAVRGNTAVVLLSNQERRSCSIAIMKGDATSPVVCSYEKEIKNVGLLSDGSTLILLRSGLEKLSDSGKVLQSMSVSDSYDSMIIIGPYLFLHGYQHIERVNL